MASTDHCEIGYTMTLLNLVFIITRLNQHASQGASDITSQSIVEANKRSMERTPIIRYTAPLLHTPVCVGSIPVVLLKIRH
jgi:hypothetical protein